MIKVITSEFKKEGLTVTLSFSIVDEVISDPPIPYIILDSFKATLTIPTGLTVNQMRNFIANESLNLVQNFYNSWKQKSEKEAADSANREALDTYINNNLVL